MDCSACGATNASDASFCGNCGPRLGDSEAVRSAGIASLSGQGAATAATVVSATKEQPSATYAGRWRRVGAWAIDTVIVWFVVLTCDRLVRFFFWHDSGPFNFYPGSIWSWLIGRAAYNVLFTAAKGQTPGKMALSIRVTDTTGKKPGFAQVVLRETVGKFLSGLLLGIGYLWLVFDARRQSLHDKLAKTYVMDR